MDDAGEPAPNPPVIGVRGVFRTYARLTAPVRALRGVEMAVAAGEFVAVMGPSGCGKSTLLHVIAGLDRPDEGEIDVAGTTLGRLDEKGLAMLRRTHIGFVFQFFNLLEGMSVLENVTMPALLSGARRRTAERRARAKLDLLGLADQADAAPATLSGGQRQRLAIARAMANEPTVLLADEPTGSLDSAGSAEVLELFRRLHEAGQTIVMVTHDPEVAASAGRVITMRDGRAIAAAPSMAG